jgi:hypothetical protein
MTKARVKSWYGTKTIDLEEAVAPYTVDVGDDDDLLALYVARELERTVGRLLAALVEHNVLDVASAARIADKPYTSVERVDEA